MSTVAILEQKMRHRVARDTKQEWRDGAIFSTCERCNQEVYGYDDWDEDRGRIFIGWFSDGGKFGITHCPDEAVGEDAKRWREETAKLFKR